MELKTFVLKCPVCGTKNMPIEFAEEIGIAGPKVKASYICAGERKRLFRRAKQCKTRYKIELYGDEAKKVLEWGGTNSDV